MVLKGLRTFFTIPLNFPFCLGSTQSQTEPYAASLEGTAESQFGPRDSAHEDREDSHSVDRVDPVSAGMEIYEL